LGAGRTGEEGPRESSPDVAGTFSPIVFGDERVGLFLNLGDSPRGEMPASSVEIAPGTFFCFTDRGVLKFGFRV